jgi:hypothetical protein
MNWKKFGIAFIAVYIVNRILSFLIHAVWLGETYGSLSHLWRPDADLVAKQWIMFVTAAFYCFFFVYIYIRGCENKGLIEGIRFGAIIGLFFGVPMSYDWYVILAIPYSLALKWFLSGMLTSIIMGVVVATLYKPEVAVEHE